MSKAPPLAWDTETHLIKPGMCAPKLVCLSTADHTGRTQLLTGEQAADEGERLIREEHTTAHHAFFDLGVMSAERPRIMPEIFKGLDEGRIECTKIRQMIIDNAAGTLKFIWDEEKGEFKRQRFDLGRLIGRHLGYDVLHKKEGTDIWRLRYNELDGVPLSQWPSEAKSYAIDDSVDDLAVWCSQQENDVEPDEIIGLKSQMQAGWGLYLMQMWGHRTDPEAIEQFEGELKDEMAKQIAICHEYGYRRGGKKYSSYDAIRKGLDDGAKFSRDMKAIKKDVEAWYKDQDRYEMMLTPKGDIATKREQLTRTKHPGLVAVAETVYLEKRLSTYVAALKRGTEVPLNPSYNPIIETFRTSCSGGMKIPNDEGKKIPVGWNVQNLPRFGKVRYCVVPRDGYYFGFADYDTLEMLTLGQVCLDLFGYSEIAEAARAGQDFHCALAADMLGMPYDQAYRKLKEGDAEIKNARQFCKIGNYGFAGGMGAQSFIDYAWNGYKIAVTPDHAKQLHAGYRRKWSEMNDYFNHCSALCGEGNAPQVEFVRSGMRRGRVRYTAVCNGFFQHLAAMGAKAAVYEVARECYCDSGSPLWRCRPWLFAHDEIGMEIPEGLGPKGGHEAMMRLIEVMKREMQKWCPDMPIGVSGAMARRWYKGAEPVYINGYMVPSKPAGKKWVADV